MNISGLLIYAQPQRAENVRARLEQLPGVEVHAVTADGQLVVTVEGNGEQEMTQTFDRLNAVPGVHAATLVYHHSETLDDESPAEKESKP